MDLITYLVSIINNNHNVPALRLDPPVKKLISRDKTSIQERYKPLNDEYIINNAGLLNAFPKETNWLNWENKGFRDALLDSQIWVESRGNPKAVSPAGAVGLAQFMPITWKEAKNKGWIHKDAERTNPNASLKAQRNLMTSLYSRPEMKESDSNEERYAKTLAAYNAGYGSLKKAIKKAEINDGYWLNYMANETKAYVPKIMNKTEEEYFKNKGNYISKYKRD